MKKIIFALLLLALPFHLQAAVLNDGDGAAGNTSPTTISPNTSSGGSGGLLGLSNYKETAAGRKINVNSQSATSCAKTIVIMGATECQYYRISAGLTGMVIISNDGNTATFSGSTKTAVTNTKYGQTGAGGGMSCGTFNASSVAKQYLGNCSALVGGMWASLSVVVTIAADGASISSSFPFVGNAYRGVAGVGDYQ
jgi:hypothetical protein